MLNNFKKWLQNFQWKWETFFRVENETLYEYNVRFKKSWHDSYFNKVCPYTSMKLAVKMGYDDEEIYCEIGNKEEVER